MSQRKVHVVGGYDGCPYVEMFRLDGWEIVDEPDEADLVQFTGGEDVTPALYDCGQHPATGNNQRRDAEEERIYNLCRMNGIPMTGICRGGQFLNVMNGGKMYQDVDGHAIMGRHTAYLTDAAVPLRVSSTHHQMMIENEDYGRVVMTSGDTRSTYRDYVDAKGQIYRIDTDPERDYEVEAVYYSSTECFCFQPHPEFAEYAGSMFREMYLGMVLYYLFGEGQRYNNAVRVLREKAKDEAIPVPKAKKKRKIAPPEPAPVEVRRFGDELLAHAPPNWAELAAAIHEEHALLDDDDDFEDEDEY